MWFIRENNFTILPKCYQNIISVLTIDLIIGQCLSLFIRKLAWIITMHANYLNFILRGSTIFSAF